MPRQRKRPRHLKDYSEVNAVASSNTSEFSSTGQVWRQEILTSYWAISIDCLPLSGRLEETV